MIRLEEIEKIPLIDTHMHRVHPARAPEWGSLGGGYIPGPGQERHGRQTVLYGMILEKLRQRFGMAEDASPEEVERERFLRYGKDPKGYYADLIGECNVAMHCVETGSPIGGPLYSQEEKAFFGASIPEEKQANIVRIDRVIDGLTPEGETFEQYTRRFLAELDREIRDQKAVGLKSCAAYSEGGLDVRPVEGGEAGQAYDRLRAGSARAGDERILRSWLLMESLQAAEEKDLPVQFHTGHGGGSWIDFPTMNPLCLVELNWMSLTRGPLGIMAIPKPSFLGFEITTPRQFYFMILVLVALSTLVVSNLMKSRVGYAILAIRDDELAAEAMGIHVFRYKMIVFILSSLLVGLAGAFYATYTSYIDPSSFAAAQSNDMLVMVIFGGLGNTVGSFIGAISLSILPEALRDLAQYRQLIYGVLLVLLMMVKPQGLLGDINFKYIRQRMEHREKSKEAANE